MNIFSFSDFGQTFLAFISCICWINDINTLIDYSPSTPCPYMHLNIDHPTYMLDKKVIFMWLLIDNLSFLVFFGLILGTTLGNTSGTSSYCIWGGVSSTPQEEIIDLIKRKF